MKLFTPEQKENQRKLMQEIRAGNIRHCSNSFFVPAGKPNWRENETNIVSYDRFCLQGGLMKIFVGLDHNTVFVSPENIKAAWEKVGYAAGRPFIKSCTQDERDIDRIVRFNDEIAEDMNDMADYLVREHGWQDIK